MPERSRTPRNPHAVALGRRGGLVGGHARAKKLSAEQRSAISSAAAKARWGSRTTKHVATSKTRERIITAARTEFLRSGLDGARLDRIARSARVNKRMIYYYFGSKDGLFREMLRRSTGALMQIAVSTTPGSLGDELVMWEEAMRARPHWLRLSMWEALGAPSHWIAASERQDFWRGAVHEIRLQQKNGRLPQLDAAQLQLTLLSIVMFPYLLPQMAELITGMRVASDQFLDARRSFLREMGALLTANRGTAARDR